MRWFAVHAIHFFEYVEGPQSDHFVWEHIYLIRADSPADANRLGEVRAKQDEAMYEEGGLKRYDRPVNLKFAGIRMVVSCQDEDLETGLPTHGTELSYQEFGFTDPVEFEKYVNGRDAVVRYFGVAEEDE